MDTANGVQKLGLGWRTAQWLRRVYPVKARDNIAAEFDVSGTQAKRWLAGLAPATWHLEEMAARWGKDFVHHVFQDAFEVTRDRLAKRRACLEAQLKGRQDALAEAKNSKSGGMAALARSAAGAGRATVRGLIGRLKVRSSREAA
ncbi:hypothetical protein ACJ41P_10405 [Azospirillum argentinense]|uniref:Uncharacterized protein n=1 Tax=Azospirillum argentinense TaxID=2970906 RepID=A0ABW8V5U7_9PROT